MCAGGSDDDDDDDDDYSYYHYDHYSPRLSSLRAFETSTPPLQLHPIVATPLRPVVGGLVQPLHPT